MTPDEKLLAELQAAGDNPEPKKGRIRGFFDKIGQMLGMKPKAPKVRPRVGMGHRGIAMGDFASRPKGPDGEPLYTAEEIAKWRTLGSDEATEFVYKEAPLYVHSTNVAMAQYFRDAQKMMVEFHNEGVYLYSNVSENEAIQFVQAQSKGSAIWDLFRVRGSKTAHKKPYVKIK